MTVTAPLVAQTYIDALIGREGKYSNNPNDPGGETMWGITAANARRFGYLGPMREMPRETAASIYFDRYWIKPGFARVCDISPDIAAELLDTGVNMGPAVAATFLQQCLNGLNRQGKDFPDVAEDGDVGPATLKALKAYVAKRGEEGVDVLLKLLNCLQGARYVQIVRGRPASEDFLYGWVRTRIGELK